MSAETFVDLSYRGLSLGRRVKLTLVRPSSGYLELAGPMPVGTAISIVAEDGTLIEATVTDVREQVANSPAGTEVAGMTVRPRLDGNGAAWWKAKAVLPDVVKPEVAPQIGIVRSKRVSESAVPELMDDGRNTAVQEAVDPAKLGLETEPDKDTQVIPVIPVPSLRESNPQLPVIVDDGKRTVAMGAIDLAALGLEPMSASGPIPIITDSKPADDDDGAPESGPAGAKKKRKRR